MLCQSFNVWVRGIRYENTSFMQFTFKWKTFFRNIFCDQYFWRGCLVSEGCKFVFRKLNTTCMNNMWTLTFWRICCKFFIIWYSWCYLQNLRKILLHRLAKSDCLLTVFVVLKHRSMALCHYTKNWNLSRKDIKNLQVKVKVNPKCSIAMSKL